MRSCSPLAPSPRACVRIRVHVGIVQGTKEWYEMQDLHVDEIMPQMIALSEAYVQVYELVDGSSKMQE